MVDDCRGMDDGVGGILVSWNLFFLFFPPLRILNRIKEYFERLFEANGSWYIYIYNSRRGFEYGISRFSEVLLGKFFRRPMNAKNVDVSAFYTHPTREKWLGK